MIRLIVSHGEGDRPAQPIQDDLIIDLWMAGVRGKQELTKLNSIFRVRELQVPHAPARNIGDYKEVVVTKMGLVGLNEITGINITIDNGGLVSESISALQIAGEML